MSANLSERTNLVDVVSGERPVGAPGRTDGPAVRPCLGMRELAIGRDHWARRLLASKPILVAASAKESVLLAPVRSTDLFSDYNENKSYGH